MNGHFLDQRSAVRIQSLGNFVCYQLGLLKLFEKTKMKQKNVQKFYFCLFWSFSLLHFLLKFTFVEDHSKLSNWKISIVNFQIGHFCLSPIRDSSQSISAEGVCCSVTRWQNYFSKIGHLHQWKFAHKHEKIV